MSIFTAFFLSKFNELKTSIYRYYNDSIRKKNWEQPKSAPRLRLRNAEFFSICSRTSIEGTLSATSQYRKTTKKASLRQKNVSSKEKINKLKFSGKNVSAKKLRGGRKFKRGGLLGSQKLRSASV